MHPSLSLMANPVLKKASRHTINNEQIKRVLVQYCFLPAEIVSLLSIARKKLSAWSSIRSELTRNINEEEGSRTKGISHYDILARSLYEELGLKIIDAPQALCTKKFIDTLKQFLASSADSCVAGAIYGLENAAVPELTIVAVLINHYAASTGQRQPVITIPAERFCFDNGDANYNLNQFFAMHLLDFEVGHKNGLALAIKKQHAIEPLNLYQLEAGFEFVLNQMDQWWEEMACL